MHRTPLRHAMRFPLTTTLVVVAIGISMWGWTGHLIEVFVLDSVGAARSKPWTLLTTIFPHGNGLHLGFNVMWLWLLGTQLERAWGWRRMLGVVVASAAVSAGAQVTLSGPGIGLSGVVYALATLMYLVQDRDRRLMDAVSYRDAQIFVVWFFVCIVLTQTGAMRVGNVAHAAGAAFGWLLAEVMIVTARERPVRLAALVIASVAAVAAPIMGLSVGGTKAGAVIATSHAARSGYELLMANRNAEAARELELAVAEVPSDDRSWANLAVAYQRLDRHDDAKAAMRRAAEAAADPAQRREYEALLNGQDAAKPR